MSWLLILQTILASQQSWVNCIFYLVLEFVSDFTVEFRAAHRDQDYYPILLSSPHFCERTDLFSRSFLKILWARALVF